MIQKFDIRDPLPTGTTLLEASAGTGKTWTIAALVTRLIAEGRAELGDLLIVTFGRAASQELRERVRDELTRVERVLGGDPTDPDAGDPLVAVIREGQDQAELSRRHRRLRGALTDFDAATIATTHQFCQLVLRSLGVAGDSDRTATLVGDLDDLVLDVVDDLYLRAFGGTGNAFFKRKDAIAIARGVVNDPQSLVWPQDPDETGDGHAPNPRIRRARYARAVRTELDRRKRSLGLLGYDDLLSQLASALAAADSPARERMRRRWPIVLVDEFQDTDPVQWEVLRRAFHGHSTLILIGDPKQAIYAFRGGDVVTYLDARAVASTHQTLGANYRSDAALVTSLQAVLDGAALGDERIVVHPVAGAVEDSRLSGAPSPAPWRLRALTAQELAAGRNGAKVATARPAIARDLALDVATLLASGATFAGRQLVAGDVAVLAHTGALLGQVEAALREAGVPAVVGSSGSVLDTAAADAWNTLLAALAQPHRVDLVRSAAVTPLIGIPAADLDRSPEAAGHDPATDALTRRMHVLAELFRRHGPAAVFEWLIADGLAERLAGEVRGARTLTDLRHLAEILHEAATRERLGAAALMAWLRRQRSIGGGDALSTQTRRLDSDASAVQLLTIHRSKGMQFPVVYLPYVADRSTQRPVGALPRFHADGGAGDRCLDVSGDTDGPIAAQSQAEEDAESLRLLYVALTRAQSQLVTWWAPMTTTSRSALHRLLFGRVPNGASDIPNDVALPDDIRAAATLAAWEKVGGPVIERAGHHPQQAPRPSGRASALTAREFSRGLDRRWRRTSYTALTTVEVGADTEPEPESAPRNDEALPAIRAAAPDPGALPSPMATLPVGATFGSLVHAVLEHADPGAADPRGELGRRVAEQLVRWPVRSTPAIGPEFIDTLVSALLAVITTPLGPLAGGATLTDLGTANRLCEMDFELPLAGGDRPDATVDARLGQLAPLLRAHLDVDDPLLPFAAALADPALGDQQLRGYLTGSLDVVLRVGDRYLVVDYKTNWLGPQDQPLTTAAYAPDRLAEAMRHSSYPLQALLYAVVLHRFLRWRVPGYDPDHHLGGVLYLYVRGMCGPETPVVDGNPAGVFSWKPPASLVLAVSDLLDGETSGPTEIDSEEGE